MSMTTREQMAAVLECLNSALAADGRAIGALLRHRVACTSTLADHPFVECGFVGPGPSISGEFPADVSVLGLLNGILRAADIGTIAAEIEPANSSDIERVVRFIEYQPPLKREIY